MINTLFERHDTVILDATNTTRERRDEWQSRKWQTRFKVFNTSKEECIDRCDIDYFNLIPIIHKMAENMEPLTSEELGDFPPLVILNTTYGEE